jgi:cysteinyl-tRNA synthetase
MRKIRLHDTRSGEVLPLAPRDPGRVGIYACGPTVYSRIHIGNARPFVVFSLLKRFLAQEGYEVTLVMNITDVNDKIYDAARVRAASRSAADGGEGIAAAGGAGGSTQRVEGRETGVAAAGGAGGQAGPAEGEEIDSAALAAEMTRDYIADTDALGLGRPDDEPLASDTMDAIVDYIKTLVDSNHAYESGGDVFFRVRSDPGYGSLSHRRLQDMDQGEGVEGAERKRDPLDFALWKRRKPGEDTWWGSPWGDGRPGWHIECSAMAESLLGVNFDIHGGGADLVFPHHENEASQTRAARGAELARIWMHNGMVQITGEKMAKSVGNITPLHEVVKRYGRNCVVMYLIGGHYRQPLAFSEAELRDAERRVYRIRDALRRLAPGSPSPPDMASHRDAFFDALAEDFNTPKALASLFEWVRDANRRADAVGDAHRTYAVGDAHLREMLEVLGLGGLEPLHTEADAAAIDPQAVELLARREAARRERDFDLADRLREEIRSRNWEIRDGPNGPELIPAAGSTP